MLQQIVSPPRVAPVGRCGPAGGIEAVTGSGYCSRGNARKTTMQQPQSCFFQSHGLRLHYWDWGNAAARPLLLIHGGKDHGRSWDHLARALQPHFHVIAPDLRGHGDSD